MRKKAKINGSREKKKNGPKDDERINMGGKDRPVLARVCVIREFLSLSLVRYSFWFCKSAGRRANQCYLSLVIDGVAHSSCRIETGKTRVPLLIQ